MDLLGPHERFRVFVVGFDEVLNGVNQVRYTMEDASPYTFSGDLRKPALNEIHPRGAGWDEVRMKAGVLCQPLFDVRVLVSPVVVKDQVEIQPFWCFSIDFSEEFEEFDVPVPRIA